VLGSSSGCDQGTPALQPLGPTPHVVWTYPANEATNVPHTIAIRVQFDRFLMPSTAVRGAMCLQAATVGGESTGTDQCIAAGFAPEYDPVDRVATWTIRGALTEETRYNVRLFAPKAPEDANGIRAFDGAPLEKEFTFAFTTGNKNRTGWLEDRSMGFCSTRRLCPLPDGACDESMAVPVTSSPSGFLQTTCAGGGNCHGSTDRSRGPSGSVLRLDDDGSGGGITAAVRHLVDHAVVASETATGADPSRPSRNALAPFGHNMPYIDATNPGNSFLLYKMILALAPRCPFDPNEESATHDAAACDPAAGHASWRYARDFYDCRTIEDARLPRDALGNCPSDGSFPAPRDGGVPTLAKLGDKDALISPLREARVPADEWQPPASGEYDRLRARIRGSGMPAQGMVSRAEALAISYWIADGARVEACP
jgi:Bacterial Ig-like domain